MAAGCLKHCRHTVEKNKIGCLFRGTAAVFNFDTIAALQRSLTVQSDV
jgi:hypothetical protein